LTNLAVLNQLLDGRQSISSTFCHLCILKFACKYSILTEYTSANAYIFARKGQNMSIYANSIMHIRISSDLTRVLP
jgi:hypothetical protein